MDDHKQLPEHVNAGGKAALAACVEKPPVLAVRPDGIPQVLRDTPRWVCWASVRREGKWTKVPLNPRTGEIAKANDPSTWGTFNQALAFHVSHRDQTDGVGFVFSSDDDFCGIDLDDALDPASRELKAWAAPIVADLDSYSEISPSSTGVKVFARGRKRGPLCRKKYGDGEVEVYDAARFFVVTGAHLPGTPATVEPRQEQFERLYRRVLEGKKDVDGPTGDDVQQQHGDELRHRDEHQHHHEHHAAGDPLADDAILDLAGRARNGDKFRALLGGDTGGHGGDDSAADLALLCIFAFYTKDAAQLERLFSQSKLADRDKWRERPDYRARTIARALQLVSGSYQPGRKGTAGRAPQRDHHETSGKAPTQGFTLKSLTLRPGPARRTPSGKVTVSIRVEKVGEVLAEFPITSVSSSWKNPMRQMLQLIAEGASDCEPTKPEDVERLFTKIIADAGRRADAPAVREGPTLAEIVRAKAPAVWRLMCRTDKGAWSEAKPGEVSRTEFVSGVTEDLMAECGKACDAPRQASGEPARHDLLRMIQGELLITWASTLATLPTEETVDLGANSAAGRRFKAEMVKVWTVPATWEIPKDTAGTGMEHVGATRASLISRVQSQRKRYSADADRWHRIHPALSAWWRVSVIDGEEKVFLAMRWELANQVKEKLTAVNDQEALTRLGRQFGVVNTNPPVPDRTSGSGGKERQGRLAVLSDDITEELLSMPSDAPDDDDPGDTVTPEALSPEVFFR
jgi:hypothetical protein